MASQRAARASTPKSSRPVMPAGYGVPKARTGMLGWDEVRKALEKSGRFWIATTNPNGSPRLRQQRLSGLNARGLQPVHEWVIGFEQYWNENFDRLNKYVKKPQQKEHADGSRS